VLRCRNHQLGRARHRKESPRARIRTTPLALYICLALSAILYWSSLSPRHGYQQPVRRWRQPRRTVNGVIARHIWVLPDRQLTWVAFVLTIYLHGMQSCQEANRIRQPEAHSWSGRKENGLAEEQDKALRLKPRGRPLASSVHPPLAIIRAKPCPEISSTEFSTFLLVACLILQLPTDKSANVQGIFQGLDKDSAQTLGRVGNIESCLYEAYSQPSLRHGMVRVHSA